MFYPKGGTMLKLKALLIAGALLVTGIFGGSSLSAAYVYISPYNDYYYGSYYYPYGYSNYSYYYPYTYRRAYPYYGYGYGWRGGYWGHRQHWGHHGGRWRH